MAIKNIIASGIGFNPGSIKFIPTAGYISGTAIIIPPSDSDGTSGGRILSLRRHNLVFTDRPSEVHIDDIRHTVDIELIKEDIHNLEVREQRMQHLLMAAQGLEKATKQLKRLELVQAQIAHKRIMLDEEQAILLILQLM